MRMFQRSRDTKSSTNGRTGAAVAAHAEVMTPYGCADGDDNGDSDVFVCRRTSPDLGPQALAAAAEGVTLFVYGWHNVEPGPLSWVFPSLHAALSAVRTMKNAVQWCIVSGAEWASMDAARAKGAVLIEQTA